MLKDDEEERKTNGYGSSLGFELQPKLCRRWTVQKRGVNTFRFRMHEEEQRLRICFVRTSFDDTRTITHTTNTFFIIIHMWMILDNNVGAVWSVARNTVAHDANND
jgi:hypothetical protein